MGGQVLFNNINTWHLLTVDCVKALSHLILIINLRNDLGILQVRRMNLKEIHLPNVAQIINDKIDFICLLVWSIFHDPSELIIQKSWKIEGTKTETLSRLGVNKGPS